MSYDKGKTINQYIQRNYAQPMNYQSGGYIPGVSNVIARTQLLRDEGIAREGLDKAKDKVEKDKKFAGYGQKIGSWGGKILGGMAAGALAGSTGGLSLLATPWLAKAWAKPAIPLAPAAPFKLCIIFALCCCPCSAKKFACF